MAIRDHSDESTVQHHAHHGLIGGRYQLEQRIGEGRYAITYRARDVVLGRLVALKLVRPEYAADQTSLARFAREARAAAAVDHPNIVQVYDYGTHQDQAYLVMQYIAGRNLKQVIEDEGPLEPIAATRLVRRLLRGLSAIHSAGIIHRDIKPQNVLVGDDGLVRVADFGIARGPTDATLTSHGTTVGTAAYMAPEQIRGDPVSAATDIYAVGTVLFEVLTGRSPFEVDHPVAAMQAHLHQPPPAPSRFADGIPPALDAAVLRALAKVPADRYASAADMARALEAAIPPQAARRRGPGLLDRAHDWLGPLVFVMVALTVLGGAIATTLGDEPGEPAENGTARPDAQGAAREGAPMVSATSRATATARVVRAPVLTELQPTATDPLPTATDPLPTATEPLPTATESQPTPTELQPTALPRPSPTPSPPIVPANAGASAEQEQREQTVPTTLQFGAADWQGGYFRGDAEWYGRAWTAVYGAQSPHPRVSLTFSLDAASIAPATLTITGLDDEWAGNNPIVVTVNGVEIYAAPSPFPSWDGVGRGEQAAWTAIAFEVPTDLLHEGTNEIALANLAPSASVGQPPYVLVSDAVLEITG